MKKKKKNSNNNNDSNNNNNNNNNNNKELNGPSFIEFSENPWNEFEITELKL